MELPNLTICGTHFSGWHLLYVKLVTTGAGLIASNPHLSRWNQGLWPLQGVELHHSWLSGTDSRGKHKRTWLLSHVASSPEVDVAGGPLLPISCPVTHQCIPSDQEEEEEISFPVSSPVQGKAKSLLLFPGMTRL